RPCSYSSRCSSTPPTTLVALVGGFWLLFAVGGVLSIVGGLMTLEIRRRPADAAVSSAPR
ncbi:hypothetical protein, partial [Microbacterium lacticum]|uniref:hypothetical protein n=1 Tax=Microbacterium lacticum TaxID=33885 RepID=UPI001F5A55A5